MEATPYEIVICCQTLTDFAEFRKVLWKLGVMGKGAICSLCLCEKYDTVKGYITKKPINKYYCQSNGVEKIL